MKNQSKMLVEKLNKNIQAIAFDLDGTIYVGNQLVIGSSEIINYLQNKGYSVFYFTNNSAKSKQQIVEKLQKMKLSVNPNHVYCCLDSTSAFLNQKGHKTIFCCGSQELVDHLKSNSFNVYVKDDSKILFDAVVVGLNLHFSYEIMAQASMVLQRNPQCKLIACNLDMSYPIENTYRLPGCGPIAKAIEAASGRNVDCMIGKPNTFMINLILKENNLSKDNICIVGDSEESDIAMAEKANIKSFLLGRETTKKDAISIKTLLDLKDYL